MSRCKPKGYAEEGNRDFHFELFCDVAAYDGIRCKGKDGLGLVREALGVGNVESTR